MWRGLAFVVSVLLASCVTPPADLLIRNVTVIDGGGGAPFVGDVAVDDGRIVAVGESLSLRAAETIDGGGRYLIPGLIDMHVHLAAAVERPEGLDALLAAGVTTVRDMGGQVSTLTRWRDEIARGERSGPELVIVGATLNGEQAASFHRVVASAADAAEAVSEMVAAGAVQIKVHNATPPEVLAAIIEAARARGLSVVGHVPAGPGPLGACRMGMKEISHASALLESVLWRAGSPPSDLLAALNELNGPASDELYACMAENGMAYAPNLSMYNPIIAALDEPQAAMTRRLVGVLGEISLRAKNAGVLIIAGSDSNGDAEDAQFGARVRFGEGLHQELAVLVDAGFTPSEAIMAATSNAARHLGRDDIGAIREGAQADLVLLCADPLADINNTRAISLTIANGAAVSPVAECAAPIGDR